MSVYQVEDYYIHMTFSELNEEQKKSIENHLCEENYLDYDFQDDNHTLVINEIESEFDGQNLEGSIIDLIEA